jgi:hypothetical protein
MMVIVILQYKGTNSIVLMAVKHDNIYFRYVNIDYNGRVSDDGVFHNCETSPALESKVLAEGGFFGGTVVFPL